jgi:hypothetical protein
MSVSGPRPARFGQPRDLDALIPVPGFPGQVQSRQAASTQLYLSIERPTIRCRRTALVQLRGSPLLPNRARPYGEAIHE